MVSFQSKFIEIIDFPMQIQWEIQRCILAHGLIIDTRKQSVVNNEDKQTVRYTTGEWKLN